MKEVSVKKSDIVVNRQGSIVYYKKNIRTLAKMAPVDAKIK